MNRFGLTVGKVLLAFGVVVATLAAMGAIGEVVLRNRERTRQTPPGDMPLIFYPHKRLGYALVRDFDYFGWVYVNAAGFRGRGLPEEAGDRLRVMTVGGSTTFDSFVTGDASTWPARLEHWLGELAPGCAVAVFNAGVPGYRIVDNLIRLETELYRYRPDVIVLYAAHNDLVYSFFGGRAEATRGYRARPDEVHYMWPITSWLAQHSLFYGKLAGRWRAVTVRRLRRGALKERPPDSQWEKGIALGTVAFERDLSAFLAVARNLGIQVIIPQVTHVSGAGAVTEADSAARRTWGGTFAGPSPEMVLRGYNTFDSVARAAAPRFGATHVVTEAFASRGTDFFVPTDAIHFNDRGADRMAAGLADAFLRQSLLPRDGCQLAGAARP